MKRLLAIMLLAAAQVASGQIAFVQPKPPTPYLEFQGKLPDGAFGQFIWSNPDAGVDFTPLDAPKIDVTKVAPGQHPVVLDIPLAAIVDGKIKFLPPQHWTTTVDGGVKPPDPPPVDLAKLAGADAPALATAYSSFLPLISAGSVPTTAIFRDALTIRLGPLTASPAVPEVNKRIDKAVGTDNAPLKADNTAALVVCLNGVVKDLGAPVVVPPVPGANVKVLITYDANREGSLPRPQMALIQSTALRTWLDAKVGKGNWRISPDTNVFNADQPVFQKLAAQPRQSPNWLYVANDAAAEGVPLPADEAAAEAEIGRYAK